LKVSTQTVLGVASLLVSATGIYFGVAVAQTAAEVGPDPSLGAELRVLTSEG